MKRLAPLFLFAVLTVLMIFSSCQSNLVDDLEPLQSRANGGKSQIIVCVNDAQGNPIQPPYRLQLIGPYYYTYNLIVNTPMYTFEEVPPHEYTIIVSKPGYIGQTKKIDFVVPGEGTADFMWKINMTLTPKGECRLIGPDGGVVPVKSINNGGPGIGSFDGSLRIPDLALRDFTNICLTAVRADYDAIDVSPQGRNGSYMIVCEPSGLRFSRDATFDRMPLEYEPALAAVPHYLHYKTGDPNTGDFVFSLIPADVRDFTITPDGRSGSGQINHFSAWQIVGDYQVNMKEKRSDPLQITGYCSKGLFMEYDTVGDWGPMFREIFTLPNDSFPTVYERIEIPEQELRAVRATMSHRVRAYTIMTLPPMSTVLEEGEFPDYPFSNDWYYGGCHNSGGG